MTARRLLTLTALCVLSMTMGSAALVADASYGAAPYTINFNHSTGYFLPPGTELALGSTTVADADHGRTCDAVLEVTNNESKWAGNDLTLTSASTVVATDVEQGAGAATISLGTLTLNDQITAYLTFGPGGASSLAGQFTITCPDVPPVNPDNPENPPVVTSSQPPVTAAPTATPVVAQAGFTG